MMTISSASACEREEACSLREFQEGGRGRETETVSANKMKKTEIALSTMILLYISDLVS